MIPSSGLTPAYAHTRPVPARLAQRWGRPLAVGLTVLALLWAAAVWATALERTLEARTFALDYANFRTYGERFLATGSLYLDRQLAGPYDWLAAPGLPCLYPPLIAYVVVPLVWLPALLWWLVPLAVVAGAAVRSRPPAWSWPLLALALGTPQTALTVWVGGSGMWVWAALAVGGPATALLVLKPPVAAFALLGVRHRSWWLAVGALALASLPLAEEWARYAVAVGNAVGDSPVRLADLPALLGAWWISRSSRCR